MLPMNNILDASGVTKIYEDHAALSNFSATVKKGKIVGLAGPNGAGKTTFIKILTGLIGEYQGKITICGEKIGVKSKALVSYMPDKMHLPLDMNARQCIELYKDFYSDFDAGRAKNNIEKLDIPLNKPLQTMSKGIQEKLILILTMSRNASLYILDEPLGGVDPAARNFILKTIVRNFSEESSMLISTHLISEAESYFDDVIFIKRGKTELAGNVDDIRAKYGKSLDELFRELYAVKEIFT